MVPPTTMGVEAYLSTRTIPTVTFIGYSADEAVPFLQGILVQSGIAQLTERPYSGGFWKRHLQQLQNRRSY